MKKIKNKRLRTVKVINPNFKEVVFVTPEIIEIRRTIRKLIKNIWVILLENEKKSVFLAGDFDFCFINNKLFH